MRGEHAVAEVSPTRSRTVPRNRLPLRLIAGLAVTVSVAAGIGACSGDPAPVGSPPQGSPGSSVSSSGPPATPEPTRPVEEATPASAIQFTRYFWDLYNYAYQTYDTAPLKAISASSCKFCSSTVDDISKAKDDGASSSGSTVSVIESTSPPVKITTGTLVIASVSQMPGQLTLSSGKVKKDAGWKQLRTDFSLAWNGTSWLVEGINADTNNGVRWAA